MLLSQILFKLYQVSIINSRKATYQCTSTAFTLNRLEVLKTKRLQGCYASGKPGIPRKVREYFFGQGSQGKPGKVREFCQNWTQFRNFVGYRHTFSSENRYIVRRRFFFTFLNL